MIPSFRTTKTSDRDLDKVQDSLSRIFNSIQTKEILDGRLIQDVSIVSGANEINHGLGKPIRGWIVVRKNANQTVYDSVSSTPDSTFILNASGTVTISLWVF